MNTARLGPETLRAAIISECARHCAPRARDKHKESATRPYTGQLIMRNSASVRRKTYDAVSLQKRNRYKYRGQNILLSQIVAPLPHAPFHAASTRRLSRRHANGDVTCRARGEHQIRRNLLGGLHTPTDARPDSWGHQLFMGASRLHVAQTVTTRRSLCTRCTRLLRLAAGSPNRIHARTLCATALFRSWIHASMLRSRLRLQDRPLFTLPKIAPRRNRHGSRTSDPH